MTLPEVNPEILKRFDDHLTSQGLRRTRQRDVIVRAAFSTTEHFNADELWERAKGFDKTTSRATLYRTLSLLVQSGLLREIDLGFGHTCYDPNFFDHPHHNHLVCLDCRKVVEFEDQHMDVLEDCISRRLGFRPAVKSLRIEASCEELREKGACRNRKGS
jgi:Fur family ferric uptake transcriptional regulator